MSGNIPNLESLFEAAVAIESAEERTAFVQEKCGDDRELREQLEKLLVSDAKAGSFLENPPEGIAAALLSDSDVKNRAAALDAGLVSAFTEEEAIVMGDAGHSVLKSLGQTIAVPHVVLQEPAAEGEDPVARPSSPQMPERDADSRYQLQGEIARGGMGSIIKGRDNDLGRDLAIKVLLDSHKDKPEVIQRFVEEAQIGGQLQHPGIAPVYELGQFADRRPFFSMKLVKGKTLAKLLADRENATDDRSKLVGIFEQVCQTLAYAHSRGVIHRDLKPANIMVGAFGEVQVMDWGLAKVLSTGGVADEKKSQRKQKDVSIVQTRRSTGSDVPGSVGSAGTETQMGSVMGTPAYMPPEQALGEIDQLDQRADVFGLGAILCEILTGDPPYVGDDGTQIFRLASRGKLDDACLRLESCSADAELIALAKDCLAVEPGDRPQDAGVLAERVSGYLESVESKLRQTELARAGEAARVAEQKKRLRITLALAATVLLVLAGGVITTGFGLAEAKRQEGIARKEAREKELARAAEAERAEGERLAKKAAQQKQHEAEQARKAEAAKSKELAAQVKATEVAKQAEAARAEELAKQIKQTESALAKAKTATYGARIQRAYEEVRRGNMGKALEVLSITDPAFRRWEYNYVLRQASRQRLQLVGHNGFVSCMAYSPDGKRIVSGSWDKTLKLWDAATGKELLTLGGHAGGVACVAFSPDGTRIVSGCGGTSTDAKKRREGTAGEVKVWDATTGKELLTLNSESSKQLCNVTSVAYSPDGARIVAGRQIESRGIPFAAMSVWDATTGKELLAIPPGTGKKVSPWLNPNGVETVAFSPDGKHIVSNTTDVTLRMWDATTGKETLAIAGGPRHFRYSPDGKWIIGVGGKDYHDDILSTVKVMNAPSLRVGSTLRGHLLKGHLDFVTSVAHSADGKRFVTCSCDAVKVWDATTRKEILSFSPLPIDKRKSGNAVVCMAFSPDGKHVVTNDSDKTLIIWDVTTGKEPLTFEYSAPRLISLTDRPVLAFSPDGKRIVTGGRWFDARTEYGDVTVWDATTGKELLRPATNGSYAVKAVAFSPDGKHIIFSDDRLKGIRVGVDRVPVPTATVMDAATGKETIAIRLIDANRNRGNLCVACSPDGKHLVGTNQRVYDMTSGKEILSLEGFPDTTAKRVLDWVNYSPDGKRIAGVKINDGTVWVWEAKSGNAVLTFETNSGRSGVAYSRTHGVAYSGTHLVKVYPDNTAKVWDATTGKETVTLKGHTDMITCVAFSPDGKRVVTGSMDRTLKVWDVTTGQEILTLQGHNTYVLSVTFSPDGRRIASSDFSRSIKIWNAN